MSYVIIGAPVFQRAWALPIYFEYITKQSWPLDQLGFVFEAGPNDNDTMECLIQFHAAHPELKCFDVQINHQVPHRSHPEGARSWTRDHYAHMATMRNNLLKRVSCYDPDRYFSLDTDILLEDPDTIAKLYDLTAHYPAVNPLLYMTPTDINFPSVMSWVPDGRARRALDQYPIGKLFRADVIMAAVMMSKPVYKTVRYQWHLQGEDLGWSRDLANKGFSAWCASDIYAPHIMSRALLEEYKNHGDIRKTMYLEKIAANQ